MKLRITKFFQGNDVLYIPQYLEYKTFWFRENRYVWVSFFYTKKGNFQYINACNNVKIFKQKSEAERCIKQFTERNITTKVVWENEFK